MSVFAGSSARRRSALRALGAALALVCLAFVAARLWEGRAALTGALQSPWLALTVAIGSVVYAASSLLLALAWRRSLRRFDGRDAGARACIAVYGRTQIAKYVPGNVFHFVGRHALARRLGYGDAALARAALTELAGVVLAAAAVALGGLAARGAADDTALPSLGALAGLAGVAALALAADPLIARRAAGAAGGSSPRGAIPALLLYLAFVAVSGLLLLALCVATAGPGVLARAGHVAAGYAISWVAGFATPGASAGVGVREAILVLWLGDALGPGQAAVIAVAWRVVTIAGDALFFASTIAAGTDRT